MLLDSNIIIYAVLPEHQNLRTIIRKQPASVSAISQIEVLGYHRLTETDRSNFASMFHCITVFPINHAVIEKAIALRQLRKMSLGDAIIAATALIHQQPLMTRNSQDFAWIENLTLINPFDETP